MKEIKYIVVHCTATPESHACTVERIDQMHRARGFKNGCGYHWVIYQDGTVHRGRPETMQGAHVKGHNHHSIGVCYVGGLRFKPQEKRNSQTGLTCLAGNCGRYVPADTRTAEQKEALVALLKELHQRYPKAEIVGHRDLSPDLNGDGVITRNEWIKACPCFDVFPLAQLICHG